MKTQGWSSQSRKELILNSLFVKGQEFYERKNMGKIEEGNNVGAKTNQRWE